MPLLPQISALDLMDRSMDHVTAFELMFADGAGERQLESDQNKHIFRASLLVRLLMFLEHHGKKFGTPELDAIREMRNAVVHNGGDLSLNKNSKSVSLVTEYLNDLVEGHVPSANPDALTPFFSLHGTNVAFDKGPVNETFRQIFMKNVPSLASHYGVGPR